MMAIQSSIMMIVVSPGDPNERNDNTSDNVTHTALKEDIYHTQDKEQYISHIGNTMKSCDNN